MVAGALASALVLLDSSDEVRSFAFDALALIAACGGVYGIVRNRPTERLGWILFAVGLGLFAAGDIAYDLATRVAGGSGFPWADLLYLPAYPFIVCGLYRLARHTSAATRPSTLRSSRSAPPR